MLDTTFSLLYPNDSTEVGRVNISSRVIGELGLDFLIDLTQEESDALAKFCDGALIVVGYQKGRQQEIGDAVANIKQTGCKMLGAVLNGVKFNSMSNKHYYYSSERYSAHYSKRYNGRKK